MPNHYSLNIWQVDLKELSKSLQFQSGWNKCSYHVTDRESNILEYCITCQHRKSLFEPGVYAMSVDFQLIFKLLFSSLSTATFTATNHYRFVLQPVQHSTAYHLMNKMGRKYLGCISGFFFVTIWCESKHQTQPK